MKKWSTIDTYVPVLTHSWLRTIIFRLLTSKNVWTLSGPKATPAPNLIKLHVMIRCEKSFYVMLCVMLWHATSCYVMLCYVMLCYVMLCHVMLYYVMLCYDMLYYVILCYAMTCYVMLCYVMLCYVMLC